MPDEDSDVDTVPAEIPETQGVSILTPGGRKGPLTGAEWDRYRIGDMLGQGGMATVYLAMVKESGRHVALKVMLGHSSQDPDARRRFQLEAEAARRIDSPHVVRVHHSGTYHGILYMEQEFIPGTSLADLLRQRRDDGHQLTRPRVLRLARETALGLQAAAKEGIVHRDIKPSNLLLTKDGSVKITDFGVVKLFGEQTMTVTGMAIGTPSYMSPEQARTEAVDLRSDIYSFGVVLYETCTGKQPFVGASPEAVLYKHHYAEPELPSTLSERCDSDLEAIILKCMQKKPERRYQSCEELLADIAALEAGQPPLHAVFKRRRETGAKEMLSEAGVTRRKLLLATTILLAIGIMGGLGYWWFQQRSMAISELRSQLSGLDRIQTPPADSADDIAQLRSYVGDDDPDLRRWAARLDLIKRSRDDLQSLLSATDAQSQRPLLAERANLLAELVGPSDADVQRARRLAAEWDREEQQLRASLAVLDQAALDGSRIEAAKQDLAALALLVPAEDAALQRWTQRCETISARIASADARITQLTARGIENASDQAALTTAVADLADLLGEQDERVRRGRALLNTSRQRIASLQRTLVILDSGSAPTRALRTALADDLAAYQRLMPAEDAQARRWSNLVEQAAADERQLQTELAARFEAGIISPEIPQLRERLQRYRQLAGPDDQQAQRWQAALDALSQAHQRDRALLDELLGKELLAANEVSLLQLLLTRLQAIDGIDAGRHDQARALLDRCEIERAKLAQQLSSLDQRQTPAADSSDLLSRYRHLVGADDPQAVAWGDKLTKIRQLKTTLSQIDLRQRPASGLGAELDALAALVGDDDPDLRRWRARLNRIEDLQNSLALLDRRQTEDPTCEKLLAEWIDLVGGDDSDSRRWQQALARIQNLRRQLLIMLNNPVGDPAQAETIDQLAALVGEDDALVQRGRRHLQALAPPDIPAWADHHEQDRFGHRCTVTVNDVGFAFRYVPPGQVMVGSPLEEAGRDSDEQPAAVIVSRGFWMAEHELSQEQWQALLGPRDWFNPGAKLPADQLSVADVNAVCQALVDAGTGTARLPSEAEWALACRAGGSGPLPPGSEGDIPRERLAWFADNAGGSSQPVAQLLPNRLGLYDMLGNCWEWCDDGDGPQAANGSVDPRRPVLGKQIIRGASWGDAASAVRCANRGRLDPRTRSAYVGARLVIDAE